MEKQFGLQEYPVWRWGLILACRCPGCKKLLHMTFNEERKEMNLERFKDYQKRHGKECEANAKTDGKGSGI